MRASGTRRLVLGLQAGLRGVLVAALLAAGCDRGRPTPIEATPPETAPPAPPPRGCGAPPGVFNENCSRDAPSFLADVEVAIEIVAEEHPDLFDFGRRPRGGCGRCWQVLDPERFVEEVVATLEKMGYCAFYDGEELGVKLTNAFNDQFDILTWELFLRREEGAYRSTCRPAWF